MALSSPTPRWPQLISNAPNSTASGTTLSHRMLIPQIAHLFPDKPLDQIANVDHGSARRSSRRRAEQVAEEICQLRRAQSPRSTALRVLREKQILPPGIEERAAAATYPVP